MQTIRGGEVLDDAGVRVWADCRKVTRLLLVRHAPPDAQWAPERRLCGWFDPPLGEPGVRVAATVAEALALSDAPALYASPLRRAWETAVLIGGPLGLEPSNCDALREINCGELDGLFLDDVRRRFPDLWRRNVEQTDEHFRWPGGESYAEFRDRVRTGLDTLAARHTGETVLVVTHTGVVTQVLGMVHGWSSARWDRDRPAFGGVTRVSWGSGGPLGFIT